MTNDDTTGWNRRVLVSVLVAFVVSHSTTITVL